MTFEMQIQHYKHSIYPHSNLYILNPNSNPNCNPKKIQNSPSWYLSLDLTQRNLSLKINNFYIFYLWLVACRLEKKLAHK